MADETRATFAPVHRPQPPQIVKSCLHPSRNFNSLWRIVSSFSFFRKETFECSTIILHHLPNFLSSKLTILDHHPPFSLKRRAREKGIRGLFSSQFSSSPKLLFPIVRNFAGSLKSFELANGYYYSCSTYSPPIRYASRQGFLIAAGIRFRAPFPPTMVSSKV